jgi:hypothetical protein
MDKDSALRKIKKCLQLAKSNNPNEAAAALRQARLLMQECGIGQSDTAMFDIGESMVRSPSASPVLWQSVLAQLAGVTFGCDFFTRTHWQINDDTRIVRVRNFVFIGANGSQDVASYAFDVLARQCGKARANHVSTQRRNCKQSTKTARGDAFALGWVEGVEEVLKAFAAQPRPNAEIEVYLKHKYPSMGREKLRDRISGANLRGDELHDGRQAGRAAQLHRAVGTVAPRAMLRSNI